MKVIMPPTLFPKGLLVLCIEAGRPACSRSFVRVRKERFSGS